MELNTLEKKVEVELQEHLAMEPTIQWKGEKKREKS